MSEQLSSRQTLPLRIAMVEVREVDVSGTPPETVECRLRVKRLTRFPVEEVAEQIVATGDKTSPKEAEPRTRIAPPKPIADEEQAPADGNGDRWADAGGEVLVARGESDILAIAGAVSMLCRKPLHVISHQREDVDGACRCVVAVSDQSDAVDWEASARGSGRANAESSDIALTLATIRAANHAGLLKREYRANNQKVLRQWSRDAMLEISECLSRSGGLSDTKPSVMLEIESIVLDYLNLGSSAAVITASNQPRPETILSLFDTSVWLYDEDGRPRKHYTETDLWLAWYPGVDDDDRTVGELIESMPAAPASAIPWIVRLFENPTSPIRFRGAIDLHDHDVLHVLLGRGLQDQDEAFVLGFAMGTAKKVSRIQYHAFKFLMARVYPEPYRIPGFLQPAFDLGVQCGKKTGAADLYKQPLKELRSLTIAEARRRAGIDMEIVRQHYQIEQQRIPFTIASLRLP
ncbi:hypothetical protein [Rhodopirellula sallentina]|uniref:Uncharacterized protein n=1 Tax=Rhodopirellula sallentina SM41 TaxID=1263870 RepID=M5UFG4_9BACT|nr:hypothetical protein [Rhodopirellula sallentina]EMI54718.1 hypothetical protein RSSM_03834 [Rhodopirellula sallentina SM41]